MTTRQYTREEIFAGVREDVAECLAVDVDEITLETNFAADLAGESIDVLDLAFRNEKRFGFRSPLLRVTDKDRWIFGASGKLTEESLRLLQADYPNIDWQRHLGNVSFDRPIHVFTIDLIVDLVFDAQFNPTPIQETASTP